MLFRSQFTGLKARWVTLTVPNEPDRDAGLSKLKERFRRFSRTKLFNQHVIGGVSFYEWTQSPDKGDWNVHYHGLWVGDYWPHETLLAEWQGNSGVGGARIEGSGSTRKRINYCVSYAKKQTGTGLRLSQPFGCLYGTALAEIESALKLLDESSIAGLALD